CRGRGLRELEIHLYRAAGIFRYAIEARAVRGGLHFVSYRGGPDLQICGAGTLSARAPSLPAISDRNSCLLPARRDVGLLCRDADAGPLLARYAATRRRRNRPNRSAAQGRRISIPDDVADLCLRGRVPASGDPDIARPGRDYQLRDVAQEAPVFHRSRLHHRRRTDAAGCLEPIVAGVAAARAL